MLAKGTVMQFTIRSSMTAIAVAILLLVATQVFYMAVVYPAGPETVLRPITWMVEMAAFTVITIAALVLSARSPHAPLVWAAIAVSGLLNMIQVGIGLAMFPPAASVMEQVPALFDTVLKGAFFLYFTGKLLFGLAAIALGRLLLSGPSAMKRAIGGLAILAGLAATALNILALPTGLDWMMPAGASGTAASALLAVAILLLRDQFAETER